jgi:hypothetical protein
MNLDHIFLRRVWLCGAACDIEIKKDGFSVMCGGNCIARGGLGERITIDKISVE